jgi:guanine deaminase
MHFHWVQDDVRQMPKDNLLHWLENYTWPYEAKFQDQQYSAERAQKFAQELLRVGTLGGAVYCSIHEHSVSDALEHFVGDFIAGNVLMTMNSPDYLLQSEEEALESVQNLSAKYREQYALTPRFAITTSDTVMIQARQLIEDTGSFIQTHLSETKNEIDFVMQIYREREGFKDVVDYTDIYDRCSLLGERTIMGHGIHLSERELKRLAQTNTLIAHCPTSNAPVEEQGLGSGLFDFERCEDYGVNWALATDIGAGPYLSMFDVIRSFVEQNANIGQLNATYTKAIYRATRAGEKFLHPERIQGTFTPGRLAQMIMVPIAQEWKKLGSEELLHNIIAEKQREDLENLVSHTWYKNRFLF